jgi:hypothetical protein
MDNEITEAYAEAFDAEREVLGPEGPLTLLQYVSKDAQGAITYEVLKEYDTGWRANRIKGADGAFYTFHEIADVDGSLQQIIDGRENQITDYVIENRVYKLEPDKITRPLVQPKVWIFQGYDKNELYS